MLCVLSYQRHIRAALADIHRSENDIDEIRTKITSQKALILSWRAEADRLKKEAQGLRREADSRCMP